jgi:hypothetical protein
MWECCRRLWWFLGIEPEGVSWAERAVSALGGFLGIGATALMSFKVSGASGADWSVRQIIDQSRSRDPEHDMAVYRVVDGRGLRSADRCTRREFARWAEWEVFPNQPENP